MLSPIEMAEIRSRAAAMPEEEKIIFLQEIPSPLLHEELYRRDQMHEQTLNRIINVLNGTE